MKKNENTLSYQILSYYEDGVLSEKDRLGVEAVLQSDEESRKRLEALRSMDRSMCEVGRRERIRSEVKSALKAQPNDLRHRRTVFPGMQWKYIFGWSTAFACCLLVWFFASGLPSETALLRQIGDVQWSGASGQALSQGDAVVSGKDSFAQIRMGDGKSIVEMGSESQIALLDRRRMRVDRGVVCNIVSKDPNDPYRIETPHGAVTVLGTIFEVQVTEKDTTVRVREGRVQVESSHGASLDEGEKEIVTAGQETVMDERTIAEPRAFPAASFASWRKRFPVKNLDVRNIADIISDSKNGRK
ncbi:MAG: FecR domain-containing protein [Candidatus Omnitrophica bacterium]|nr:FecR domain-containing protein [Candidatus Omnitrophota bacterium]